MSTIAFIAKDESEYIVICVNGTRCPANISDILQLRVRKLQCNVCSVSTNCYYL